MNAKLEKAIVSLSRVLNKPEVEETLRALAICPPDRLAEATTATVCMLIAAMHIDIPADVDRAAVEAFTEITGW